MKKITCPSKPWRRWVLSVLLTAVWFTANAQHTIILKSGEKMSGEVKSLNDSRLIFIFKGNSMTFLVSEIESVQFNQKANADAADAGQTTTGLKGVSFDLAGRKFTKPPVFENLTFKKGTVVTSVAVDKYGHVKKAEPGAEGTTTTDEYLLKLAQQGCEKALFDNCPKCPLEMRGTITIKF
ncbi:MAG: hypothetical protein ACHQNT_12925 [Bacteroidia bacterium]